MTIYIEWASGQNCQVYNKLAAPCITNWQHHGNGLPYNISSSERVKALHKCFVFSAETDKLHKFLTSRYIYLHRTWYHTARRLVNRYRNCSWSNSRRQNKTGSSQVLRFNMYLNHRSYNIRKILGGYQRFIVIKNVSTSPYAVLWKYNKRRRNPLLHIFTALKEKPRDIISPIMLPP